MKIIILDGYTLNPGDLDWEPLKKLGECVFYDRTPIDDDEEIMRRIGDSRIVLTHKTPLRAKVLSRTPQLRYIGVMGTGYDVIDIAAAKQAGVTVTNIPAYGTDAVAQFTFALLLEITSHVGLHNNLVHAGRWSGSPDFTFWDKPLMELRGKTLGLVGYGRIAQKVARLGHAFSMNVIFYNHRPKDFDEGWLRQVSLDELLQKSDVISLHVFKTPETTNLIRRETIQRMKDGVILLNTSRGGLLNEADTAAALNSGKIYAAAVDVAEHEPLNAESPLLAAKNCYITPHIAWAPKETRARLLNTAVENLTEYLAGRKQNAVT